MQRPGVALRLKVLCRLVEARGGLVSVHELSSVCGGNLSVTRQAVLQLRRDGWTIVNLWGRGYRLEMD